MIKSKHIYVELRETSNLPLEKKEKRNSMFVTMVPNNPVLQGQRLKFSDSRKVPSLVCGELRGRHSQDPLTSILPPDRKYTTL